MSWASGAARRMAESVSQVLRPNHSSQKDSRGMLGWDTPRCLGCQRPVLPRLHAKKSSSHHLSRVPQYSMDSLYPSLSGIVQGSLTPRSRARCWEGLWLKGFVGEELPEAIRGSGLRMLGLQIWSFPEVQSAWATRA